MWLLRAYSGSVTPSSLTWSGFGNGQLQTGVNADGSGVRTTYINQCATRVAQANATTSSSLPPLSTSPPSPPTTSDVPVVYSSSYETSFLHKLLAPLSLVILLPVILSLRWAMFSSMKRPFEGVIFMVATFAGAIVAFALGIAGLALGFTTISRSDASNSHLHLKTGHGIAGLFFFLSLYIIIPLIYALILLSRIRRRRNDLAEISEEKFGDTHSVGNAESEDVRSLTPSFRNASPPPTTRTRTMSWDTTTAIKMAANAEGSGPSNESSVPPTPSGFEVLNRPSRAKTTTGHSPPPPMSRPLPSTLSDIDWLLRRRSLNAVVSTFPITSGLEILASFTT